MTESGNPCRFPPTFGQIHGKHLDMAPICKKIVENMGGAIHAESEEGYGSTFIFSLPKDVVPDGNLVKQQQVETR